MTEREFWVFMGKSLKKGRIPMVSGCIDSEGLEESSQYIGGHALLPPGYESISGATIIEFGELLRNESVATKTKEAILMILAHHVSREALIILKAYNKCPNEELAIFAELALQECEWWNE
jgi:hypothetical protein